MKLKTNSNGGSFTLAVLIVVAAVAVVGLGGCVVYKLQKKVDQFNDKRKQDMTNEVENFSQSALDQYKSETEDSNAFALTTISWATQEINTAWTWMVQTSTNLHDWVLVIETKDSAAADTTIEKALAGERTEPQRFFRLLSKP